MKRLIVPTIAVLVAGSALAATTTTTTGHTSSKATATMTMPQHGMVSPADLKWGPPPPVFAAGAQMAVVQGDPASDGKLYVVRLKMPDGYKVMPHWHPTAEYVTVISGTFHMATGSTFDDKKGAGIPAGGFGWIGPKVHHYGWASGETEIQVHGVGPFKLVYVNPADDPSHTAAK